MVSLGLTWIPDGNRTNSGLSGARFSTPGAVPVRSQMEDQSAPFLRRDRAKNPEAPVGSPKREVPPTTLELTFLFF